MKFQKSGIVSLLICLLLFAGCSKDDEPLKEIEVAFGPYMFVFPAGFKHIPEQGIDSSPGTVTNGKMVFNYDYGSYNSPPNDFPGEEEVIEENIEGHYLRMARPLDPQNGRTNIYLYRLDDVTGEEGELVSTLLMTSTNLTPEEQELAISIFSSLTIIPPN